jgi:uncharacterized protein (DUF1501 family)
VTRRHFFSRSGRGIGVLALASLLDKSLLAGSPGARSSAFGVKPPHFAPKAKRVIYLFMYGGPSQLDLFDFKPKLAALDGQPVPEELIKGDRFAFLKGIPKLVGTKFQFACHGQSGAQLSELLPHTAEIVDDLAIVHSMHTDAFNHDPATTFINTGSLVPGRPAMGSWVTYGLGSESEELPGFVVLVSGDGNQPVGAHHWGSGFLPSSLQGVQFRTGGDPVLAVSNPPGVDSQMRRQTVDVIRDLDQMQAEAVGDPEILTRILSFEMAYRMQTSVPELMDLSKEPQSSLDRYGAQPGKSSFANNCLLARRLSERGVRFVQLFHRDWDHHGELITRLPQRCLETDRACAALVKDLKERGLLDETLVIWGGEFGRTPMLQGDANRSTLGRDHHPHAYTIWLAGGGIKPGLTLGTTDELGYRPVADPVHVHDFQATVLHLLGLDHTRLTFKYQGREFRLTDVEGDVVTKLLA